MASVKENVDNLVDKAQKFSLSGGAADSAFKQLYMKEIKKLEREICDSGKIDDYLTSLKRHLTHRNPTVRERVAYLCGELMLLKQDSRQGDQLVKQLIECSKDTRYFHPINTAGREIVNALGKSSKREAEEALLRVLKDPSTKSIRQNILVALGKTGGGPSVEILSGLLNSKLSISDQIHTLWALGRLGSVQNNTRSGFPLPRSLFEKPLNQIFDVIHGSVTHPTIHYCAIYAVGEICDKRDESILQDSLSLLTLQKAEATISAIHDRQSSILRSIKTHAKFSERADFHAKNILDISEKVTLKMIRGQKLDSEGEKILFKVRILFDVIAPPETRTELPDVLIVMESDEPPEITDRVDTDVVPEGVKTKLNSPETKRLSEKTQEVKEIEPATNTKTNLTENDYIFESKEDILDELNHQLDVRRALKGRLRPLELQKAHKGITSPAEVITEINDINKWITQVEAKIKRLTDELDKFV